MQAIEWIAAALGIVNVALVVRRSVWNYPFGIAMVSLYFFVFADARLYSDALLQLFFLALNVYGWRNWRASERAEGEVVVERLTASRRAAWLLATVGASLLWGFGMMRLTDAAAPFADAAIAGLSVSAQLLQSIRKVEAWILWIAVDIFAVGLFVERGLLVTAGLYAVFLAMAVAGLRAWQARLVRAA